MPPDEPRRPGRAAFGHPGLPPRWSPSKKEGVGTAYNTASRVWFTLSHGILNEVYFPRADSPQTRDLQFLVTDGEGLFHEEKRDLESDLEELEPHVLGYRVTTRDPKGRYRLVKEVLTDPHLPSVLVRVSLEGDEDFLAKLRLHVLLAPHLEGRGWGNNARVTAVSGRTLLTAHRGLVHLALGATAPFARASCGYVGVSDGWTDLRQNGRLTWEFERADDGNVALVGELDLSRGRSFTMGLAFGFGPHAAASTLLQSLAVPYARHRERFEEQWHRACGVPSDLPKASHDGGRLCRVSQGLLRAHEDKTFPGAFIASMSIPWGSARGDEKGLGGYHLVWTRDMCQSAGGLLAAGDLETPRHALIFLAASQLPDGGFHQNFWLDGQAFWRGVQLDETAFPILLAWRLQERAGLADFDPAPMVLKAAGYLVRKGPATPQERWEESSGYSPSTLAAVIAALVCAAQFARRRSEPVTAAFLEDYADFLESRVEAWTVTSQGSLLSGVPRHFIRIQPVDPADPHRREDPDVGVLSIPNRPPGEPRDFPARDVVDAGFLELVRYGVRRAGDPLVEDSLRVVDAVLKVETPSGPCWRRYNHDGFGQRRDGGPFSGWGVGRAWPLLTGERGHYELAAGHAVDGHIKAMEAFASKGGMLPEQVWDEADCPAYKMCLGRPTGSAMPLMWAHAEYLKLLRSARDGAVFDRIEAVARRYAPGRARRALEVWTFGRRPRAAAPGTTLRVVAEAPFRLRWTLGEWPAARETDSTPTAVGVHYADIALPASQRAPARFTFHWPEAGRWEGADFQVEAAS